MTKTLFLVAIAIGIAVVGQLCLKVGMSRVGYLGMERLMLPQQWVPAIIKTPQILVAVPLYFLGFLIWLIILSRAELSFVYPLLSATYILIPLASRLVLQEPIPSARWLGIAVISVGVFIILAHERLV